MNMHIFCSKHRMIIFTLSLPLYSDLRRMWAKLGIRDCRSFDAFAKRLEAALHKSPVVAALPHPADVCADAFLTWVQVAVHICEYSQAVAKLGKQRVHAAASYAPSADMVSALVTRSTELKEIGESGGVCSMIQMIYVYEAKTTTTRMPRSLTPIVAALRLAQHGMSPKACWWLNGNIVGVWEGMRTIREHVAQKNVAMMEAVHSLAATIPSTIVVEGAPAGPAVRAQLQIPPPGPATVQPSRQAGGQKRNLSGDDVSRTWSSRTWRSEAEICMVCGVSYQRSNKARHLRTEYHLAEAKQADDKVIVTDEVIVVA